MQTTTEIIYKEVKKRKPEQSFTDVARILKEKYPEHFQNTSIGTLRRRANEYSNALNIPSRSFDTKKKQYTGIGLKIISDYPKETITSNALKWLLHFPELSLTTARRIISDLSKFKKIL